MCILIKSNYSIHILSNPGYFIIYNSEFGLITPIDIEAKLKLNSSKKKSMKIYTIVLKTN